ncbi:MAG TPA: RNA methyltransferase [Candidatus Omnitrophica bacterium]|nr:RNA methyltransferase [Candidatus Omnitrophota bacterium]
MQKELPPLFIERLKKIIPPSSFETVLSSFEKTPHPSFRMHHKNADKNSIIAELSSLGFELKPVSWYADAFQLMNKSIRELQETQSYQNNHIYIQGLASMLPIVALAPEAEETILDLCAAPGSKTGQILRQMQGRGFLTANEKIKNRFFKLKNNLDAQGYSNFELTLKPGELYCKIAPNTFDRVLLDSPCSSEGRFSTHDSDSFKYWSASKIKEMVFKQRALFKSAFLALKPGGIMVYATCTYAPEENEGMLDWALGKTDDQMEILPWEPPVSNWMEGITEWEGKTYSPEVKKSRRILPNKNMTAFFIALIRKKD